VNLDEPAGYGLTAGLVSLIPMRQRFIHMRSMGFKRHYGKSAGLLQASTTLQCVAQN